MALFDDLLRNALGGQAADAPSQSRGLVENLVSMLQQSGGVDGFAKMFEQRGLGAEASSWIGTGANRSITPDQVTDALGQDRVESLASRSGLGMAVGAAAIAAVLPTLIDKLTPDGRAPKTANLGGMLDGLFRKEPAKPRADFSNVQSGSSSRPLPPEQPQEQWYTVTRGDSLSKIAKRFYGDGNRWRQIFDANRDQLKDPDLIQPGQKLKIPTAQKSL
jgi:uncharacterized protein YidB (DUF937 family)